MILDVCFPMLQSIFSEMYTLIFDFESSFTIKLISLASNSLQFVLFLIYMIAK